MYGHGTVRWSLMYGHGTVLVIVGFSWVRLLIAAAG